MPFQPFSRVLILVMITLTLTGCGTFATPASEVLPTREPVTLAPAVLQRMIQPPEGAAISQQPTTAPTVVPPTEPPPTATPTAVPPTATATATSTPTPIPPTATPASIGDPANGEALFRNGKAAAPACVTCHMVEQDTILIGPSMVGIAARAATRVEGESAEEYLRQSILEPNAYLVPDTPTNIFAAGGNSLMFQQYADYLTEQDVNDLIAYMLSLK